MSATDRKRGSVPAEELGTTAGDNARPMKPGLELRGQFPVGRDPREMTPDGLKAAGHEPMSPLQAIRAHCLDCCAHQANEVALCTAVKCPSRPFRLGTDPWRKPASDARREAARRSMVQINARRRERGDAAQQRPSGRPPIVHRRLITAPPGTSLRKRICVPAGTVPSTGVTAERLEEHPHYVPPRPRPRMEEG